MYYDILLYLTESTILLANIFQLPTLCTELTSHLQYNSKENGQSVPLLEFITLLGRCILNKTQLKMDSLKLVINVACGREG